MIKNKLFEAMILAFCHVSSFLKRVGLFGEILWYWAFCPSFYHIYWFIARVLEPNYECLLVAKS